MKKEGSIYFSFILRVLGLMVLGVTMTTGLLYYLNLRTERAIQQQVNEQIDALAEAVNVALRSMPSRMYLPEFLRLHPLRADLAPLVHHIIVTDSHGVIIDSTHQHETGQRLVAEGSAVEPEDEITFEEIRAHTEPFDPDDLKLYSFPVQTSLETPDGTRRERVVVHVLLFWKGIPGILRETSRHRLFAMEAMLSITVLLLLITVWRFTKPVNDLLQAQRRVARGELDLELKVRRRDEMGNLVETFNEMVIALRKNRELEEKLREAEQSATLGRLAAGIAHEIRNPLNFINLSLDYVKSHFPPPEPERESQYQEILASMKAELARLNRLVTDFLTFGRPTDLVLGNVDLPSLIDEVCGPLRAQAGERGVSIAIRPLNEIPAIEGDRDRLRICFSNLIINALQALPGPGHIEIDLVNEDGQVNISVSDNGPGIPEADLERIFEPYFSTKETGIGLGLALTRKIVHDHDGRITASNASGGGSVFTVILPRRHAVKPLASTVSSPSGETSRERMGIDRNGHPQIERSLRK